MQNVAMTNELGRMLDAYLDPFARVMLVAQIITHDGRIYRASEGCTCEVHESKHGAAVVVTGYNGIWLFAGEELSYVGDEKPADWEISGVRKKVL